MALQNLLNTIFFCEKIIPFGSPVVPDVYIIVAEELIGRSKSISEPLLSIVDLN